MTRDWSGMSPWQIEEAVRQAVEQERETARQWAEVAHAGGKRAHYARCSTEIDLRRRAGACGGDGVITRCAATVYGPAHSMGSKRIGRTRDGRPIVLDDDPKLRSWQQELILAMRIRRPERPWDGAVAMRIDVFVPRPKSHFGTGRNAGVLKDNAPDRPRSGRDCDKICRAIFDAAKVAGWYTDDQRVAELRVYRWWADEDGERVEIDASPIDEYIQWP